MSPKRDWYGLFAHILFSRERNRKSRGEYLFAGFLTGMFVAIGAAVTVAVLFIEINLRSIGGLLSTYILAALVIYLWIAMHFGYNDLKSVIENPLFKRSVLAGILFMIIVMIVLWIFLPTP